MLTFRTADPMQPQGSMDRPESDGSHRYDGNPRFYGLHDPDNIQACRRTAGQWLKKMRIKWLDDDSR